MDWTTVPIFGRPGPASTVRPSAYGVIANVEGEIAIVHTPKGTFLPGGGSDPGERPGQTVERESREECGFIVRVGPWRARAIEHVYSLQEEAQFEKRSTFCDATVVSHLADEGEADHELAWVSIVEAVSALSRPSHRWAVLEWRDRA